MKREMERVYQALACETRLQMLDLLSRRVLCGKALAHRLGVTPGAVSQHLRVLKDAGLVVGERRGFHVHYSLLPEGIEVCRDALVVLLEQANKKTSCDEGEKTCHVKRSNARSRTT